MNILAAINIVLFHTDGHRIWLAPWAVYLYAVIFAIYVTAIVSSALSRRR